MSERLNIQEIREQVKDAELERPIDKMGPLWGTATITHLVDALEAAYAEIDQLRAEVERLQAKLSDAAVAGANAALKAVEEYMR